MRPIPSSVAFRATNEDIAEKLHLDFFEPGTPTTLTLAGMRIETESARVQAALFGQLSLGKEISNIIEGTQIDHGVRARRLPERRLIHENGSAQRWPAGDSTDRWWCS